MSEQNYGPSPAGSVVLNLGEDIGALIIRADADLLGAEIEISRLDDGHQHGEQHGDHGEHHGDHHDGGHQGHHGHHGRTHSMVRERQTLPHPRYDAVYPDLHAGRYTIWRDAHTPAATVTVHGGQITTYRFTAAAAAGAPTAAEDGPGPVTA